MPMTLDGTAGMTAPQGAVYNGLATAAAQASTSGTSIDFTNIPVWVKRITVMFNGVTASGSSGQIIQLGSGSFETSGYVSSSGNGGTNWDGISSYSNGFGVRVRVSTVSISGSIVLTLLASNTWTAFGVLGTAGGSTIYTGGSKSLSGVVDRLRLTTSAGSETFSAGSVNIMYE